MPELPEVETVVRTVRGPLLGRRIERTQVERPDVVAGGPARLARGLKGRVVTDVRRRAKNILIDLAPPTSRAGEPSDPELLRVHLGMTGKLLFFPSGARATTPYGCVRMRLVGGGSLVYDDVRRFGGLELLDLPAWRIREARIGPEPLAPDYRPEELWTALQRSGSPVRSWLLDGRRIAGVGNIYANEALFLARVRPTRPARSLTPSEAHDLHSGVRSTLSRAIELGGTTLRDYVDADGNRGLYAENLSVYGREGRRCPRCEGTIERQVFGGRSAFFCPGCQR